MIAFRLIVSGKVQGVFYRQSSMETAISLGLSGTVRNCDNGNVEIFVEGDRLQVMQFIEWCRKGPRKAIVENIDIHECPLKNFRGFIISR